MRIGLDLRGHDAAGSIEAAVAADRLGLWAVLVTAAPGAESALGAEIAVATKHIHIAVQFDGARVHPVGIAEEVAILDHLSERRALAVIDGADDGTVDHARRLLAGEIIDGVALTPPPAQSVVATWAADSLARVALSDDLATARTQVDEQRTGGVTHLFVTSSAPMGVLARHLVTRALAPGFPDIVADYPDTIGPVSESR